jgi:anti-sigma regulatory factor (Ser/Thr protein kinase)
MASEMATLTVPGLLEQVPHIRQWLRGMLADWMVSAEVIADLALAVTEICKNIILHGYRDSAPGTIDVRLAKYGDIIRVTILDMAPTFVPPQASLPPPQALAEGGYGLALVHSLVDEFVHDGFGPHGNCITLVKKDVKIIPL